MFTAQTVSILNDYVTAKIKLKTKVYIKYALLYNMDGSWDDAEHKILLESKGCGDWLLSMGPADAESVYSVPMTSDRLEGLIDILENCLGVQRVGGVKTLKDLPDPKNPEDITKIEERFQDTAKGADNLLEALDNAKKIYSVKRIATYIYVFIGNENHRPTDPYLSLTRDYVCPDEYRRILYIDGSNLDKTNEEIVIRSL